MFISVWISRILKRQQFDLKIYIILLLLYYKRAVEGQSHNLISRGIQILWVPKGLTWKNMDRRRPDATWND